MLLNLNLDRLSFSRNWWNSNCYDIQSLLSQFCARV